MDAHAGLGAFVEGEEEDVGFAGADGGDHAFGEAEFHLAGLEIGDHDDETADEGFGFVGGFDAGEDLAADVAAEAEGELEEFFCAGYFFGGDDAGDAEVDFGEVVDGDQVGEEGFCLQGSI